jgi:concentrative nucleoside transporter, CNT family
MNSDRDGTTLAVQEDVPEKKSSHSTASLPDEKQGVRDEDVIDASIDKDINLSSWFARNRNLVRRVKLCALATLIFAWWISATVLRTTRHRWIVQTLFAWSFIAIIAFRFIPNSAITRPVEAVWIPLVQRPFYSLPKIVRYGLGWLALLAIIMGSAFGFKIENVGYLELFVFCFFSFTKTKTRYPFIFHSLIRAFYGTRARTMVTA